MRHQRRPARSAAQALLTRAAGFFMVCASSSTTRQKVLEKRGGDAAGAEAEAEAEAEEEEEEELEEEEALDPFPLSPPLDACWTGRCCCKCEPSPTHSARRAAGEVLLAVALSPAIKYPF